MTPLRPFVETTRALQALRDAAASATADLHGLAREMGCEQRGWRGLVAAVELGYFREYARQLLWEWTLQPAGGVWKPAYQLEGVVVRLRAGGRADVAWATRESFRRFPAETCRALESAGPWLPAAPVWVNERTPVVWLQRDVLIRDLMPGAPFEGLAC